MHDGRFATLTGVLEHYFDLGQQAQTRGRGRMSSAEPPTPGEQFSAPGIASRRGSRYA
jgi:hypothetical protein